MIALMGCPTPIPATLILVIADVAAIIAPALDEGRPHGWVPMPDPWGLRVLPRRAQCCRALAWKRAPRARLPPAYRR